jgi:hypothetical protein
MFLLKATANKPVEVIKYRSANTFFMLSKTEQAFLQDPTGFSSNYQRSLRCRLKVKAEKLRDELSLLNATENCSGAAEFCSDKKA